MTGEHEIQNRIRAALSPYAVLFRANVWKGMTTDGKWFDSGLPVGFSDLFGFRKSDGRAIFIEVKTSMGRPSEAQKNFLFQMERMGAIAGICRSPAEALRLIGADTDGT
ncbi:MAG: VRR-NUC domain-containing protein [Huintestinicola sp.]